MRGIILKAVKIIFNNQAAYRNGSFFNLLASGAQETWSQHVQNELKIIDDWQLTTKEMNFCLEEEEEKWFVVIRYKAFYKKYFLAFEILFLMLVLVS